MATYNPPVDVSGFATGAQGAKADSALQPNIQAGWSGNADSGDKTAVIGATATITTIATALNLVANGAGSLLMATAQKTKALQSAGQIFATPTPP